MDFYPLTFGPVYKEKIWGGSGLTRLFQRDLPGEMVGESWELSAHFRGISTVQNGSFQGEKLTSLVERYPEQILGRTAIQGRKGKFPLLVKFIDARKKLSVQVHPDDRYTRKSEQEDGKTEMWYILSARPGARIVYGLKPGRDRNILTEAIREGRLLEHLNLVEVKKGDVFFIPPGTVHALGGGIILAEIQQNSDTTYRLYDYNRSGSDGKPRPLHIQQALDVIDYQFSPAAVKTLVREGEDYRQSILAACAHFIVEKMELSAAEIIHPAGSFYILVTLSGRGELIYRDYSCQLQPGKTVLLPAALGEVRLEGRVEYLKAYLPPEGIAIHEHLTSLGFSSQAVSSFTGKKI